MKKVLLIIVAILAVAGFGVYKLVGSFGRAGQRGDTAVAAFHQDYNAKNITAIHRAAAAEFRKATSMEAMTSLADLLHDKLGEWKGSSQAGINMKNLNGNNTLELTYESTFAKAKGTEHFVFDYNGEVPVLLKYHVDSPALMATPPPAGAKLEQ